MPCGDWSASFVDRDPTIDWSAGSTEVKRRERESVLERETREGERNGLKVQQIPSAKDLRPGERDVQEREERGRSVQGRETRKGETSGRNAKLIPVADLGERARREREREREREIFIRWNEAIERELPVDLCFAEKENREWGERGSIRSQKGEMKKRKEKKRVSPQFFVHLK